MSLSFYRALEQTRSVLLELKKLIAYDLTKLDNSSGQLTLDQSVWLRSERRIHKLQVEVRDCKIALSSAIGVVNS